MRNDLEIQSRPTAGGVQRQPASLTEVSTELAQCLIVSPSASMREGIATAAREAGWETIVCADNPTAMTAVRRLPFQMAWVDLESPRTPTDLSEVCQSIAALPRVLLVIGGHQQDPEEEIWARQLGVWLYLPGVSSAQLSEIQVLCEQAYLVSDNIRSVS